MKHILDSSFRYTSSVDTDIRKRFDAIQRDKARRERLCAECEPWFDGSAFLDTRATRFLAGVAQLRRPATY